MSLDAQVIVARGSLVVDVSLQVPSGGVLAVLGPNGAGKTTTLRALAGLLPLSRGHVILDGVVLDDDRTHVPAERRPVGVVFQDYLLFPTLSARDNVAFGLRARGADRAGARATADQLLERFDLSAQADLRPAKLSGGQAQRVALARALAVSPQLLLLDEPMAALDAGTRMTVRTDLRAHLEAFGGATVLVTHDPLDALVLADHLVVVEDGRVVQSGTPAEVARAPRTDYVARLVGLNLMLGLAEGTAVALADGVTLTVASAHRGPVYVALRPSAIAVYQEQPHGSPRNAWPGRVRSLESRGDTLRAVVDGPPDVLVDLTAAAVAELRLVPGAAVWCAVKATELDVYPV
ncbi:MAG: molybdate transport system ATP-binding protein [Frankiales bacterium]|nr:molybdate transport system ATP-binding protein [Frankiales bacterium]